LLFQEYCESFKMLFLVPLFSYMPDPIHKHTILYAEDDTDDLFMVQQAFAQCKESVEIIHAADGAEAVEKLKFLHSIEKLPCLVLLDINMPGMDGREALVQIKGSPLLKNIRVFLFSTSSSDVDKAFAAKWNAEFITKPLVFSELEEIAQTIIRLCESYVAEKV